MNTRLPSGPIRAIPSDAAVTACDNASPVIRAAVSEVFCGSLSPLSVLKRASYCLVLGAWRHHGSLNARINTQFLRLEGGLGSVLGAKLAADAANMQLDGNFLQIKFAGDFLVRCALRQE